MELTFNPTQKCKIIDRSFKICTIGTCAFLACGAGGGEGYTCTVFLSTFPLLLFFKISFQSLILKMTVKECQNVSHC